jgi:hypothetical protein
MTTADPNKPNNSNNPKSYIDLNKLPLPQQFEYVKKCHGLENKSRENLEIEFRFWVYQYYVQSEKIKDLVAAQLGLGSIREQHVKNNTL